MPNVLKQYFKPIIPVPAPPVQTRIIHSEVTHSFKPITPTSVLGIYEPSNLLPRSITVTLTHAI